MINFHSSESVRCPTTGGDICVFPFKSRYGQWTKCDYNGHIYTWCATTLTADGEYDDWDYCEPAKCHGRVYLHNVYLILQKCSSFVMGIFAIAKLSIAKLHCQLELLESWWIWLSRPPFLTTRKFNATPKIIVGHCSLRK